jgi:hypothetical protein
MRTRGYASARRTRPRKGNVDARLFELERLYEAALAAKRGPSEEDRSAENIAAVRQILESRGVVQEESESLFDALARALEVSSRELRAYFMERAMGAPTVL